MNDSFNEIPVNSRILTTVYDIDYELSSVGASHSEKNYLFDLSHLALIQLQGDKSCEFLQGQLTCDMRLLSPTRIVQGAQCNLKGRILTLMDVVDFQGIHVIVPKDLLEITELSLMKTALLSRVGLKKNTSLKLFGFYLKNSSDLTPDVTSFPEATLSQTQNKQSAHYHLGDGFYVFIVPEVYEQTFREPFIRNNQLLGSLAWHTLRLQQKQISIYPNTRGLFLPHKLDLHQTPYISFDKGCYKGQEIIARMHYKATLKHHMYYFIMHTATPPSSGQIFSQIDSDTALGELIDYSVMDKDTYLVAASLTACPRRAKLENKPVELLFP